MNAIVPQSEAPLPTDPAQLSEYYQKLAEAYASTERRAGSAISIRNGVMQVGDQPIPGNQFAAIILDAVRLNTFYGTAFNPGNIVPPTCYAIGRNDAEMAPHPDMAKAPHFFMPQADRCGACPHNEFGTGRSGTGKACTNRRRLLMLLAGTYNQMGQLQPYTDANHYSETPFLTMTLPPTSIVGYGEWVRKTAADYQRPMFGVIARIYLYPHPKHGKEAIGFETIAPIPDDWGGVVIQRHQDAAREIFQGYEAPQPQAGVHGQGMQPQQQGFVNQQQQGHGQIAMPPQGGGFGGGQ